LRIDEELSSKAKSRGCPHCAGVLDRASYLRKPRGLDLPEAMSRRLGLCCRDCRRRVLPPSVLFNGRTVYWAAIQLVCVVVQQRRIVGWAVSELRGLFGVSKETLKRWLADFSVRVPTSRRWKRLRGRVPPDVRDDALPDALLAMFDRAAGSGEEAINAYLSFWAGVGFDDF